MKTYTKSGKQFVGRSVLLCVTGGIAAYKAAALTSELIQMGIRVRVVMSAGAQRFIQPLTFQALTADRVVTDLFDPDHVGVQHIELARTHDLVIVAPASANTIYRIASGAADDVVAATVLASPSPLLVAPAMESTMWKNPATQRNFQLLREDGAEIIEPQTGRLASGAHGIGRMAEPTLITQHVRAILSSNGDLSQNTLLVTAGGTREPIDPVRTLTNRSSGLMGASIAVAARDRGAKVTLITTAKATSEPGITVIPVDTAAEMSSAVKSQLPKHNTLIMAAAVSDFRPTSPSNVKLKKNDKHNMKITLEKTQDILSTVSNSQDGYIRPMVVVGFAAETQNLIDGAREKIASKRIDLIAANTVQNDQSPFGAKNVALTLIDRNGKVQPLPEMPKEQAAHRLLDQVVQLIADSASDK